MNLPLQKILDGNIKEIYVENMADENDPLFDLTITFNDGEIFNIDEYHNQSGYACVFNIISKRLNINPTQGNIKYFDNSWNRIR